MRNPTLLLPPSRGGTGPRRCTAFPPPAMALEGQHDDDTVLDQHPGSDLSISEVHNALEANVAKTDLGTRVTPGSLLTAPRLPRLVISCRRTWNRHHHTEAWRNLISISALGTKEISEYDHDSLPSNPTFNRSHGASPGRARVLSLPQRV